MTSSPESDKTVVTEQQKQPQPGMGGHWRRLVRLVGYLLVSVVSGATAVVGVFVSRTRVELADVPVPFGLVLALATAGAVIETGRVLLGRAGVIVAVATWLAGVAAALVPRPEGDIVLAGDGYGLGFCLVGSATVVWATVKAIGAPRSHR